MLVCLFNLHYYIVKATDRAIVWNITIEEVLEHFDDLLVSRLVFHVLSTSLIKTRINLCFEFKVAVLKVFYFLFDILTLLEQGIIFEL